ncbi:MAG TPA: cupin domain-containing protein [Candidatus Acidoferrales bacterium]|nr:cupin domain-containing protein [Candidatus Acidoferrales bacterium]
MVKRNEQLFEWREPAPGQKAGFGKWKNPKSPYDKWIESQGIQIHRAIGVHKVQDLPLSPWKRLGGRGIAIQLFGTEGMYGLYVVEVPGAGALNAERHMYEEIYYVVEGRGTTEVWQPSRPKKLTFEWSQGSLFAIPLNAMHRIVNATSSPALLLAATTAPNILNLIRDEDYVLNCPYEFLDRFNGEDDYFKPVEDIYADPVRGLAMRRTNIIPDILNCELPRDNRRSFDYRRIEPHMAGANFYMKIAQYKTGQYSKAHKHTSGAILVCIKGKGYSYTWPDRLGMRPWEAGLGDQVKKQTYEPVGMISAAPMAGDWFHQHFGTHPEGLRLLVFDGPYGPGFRRGGAPGDEAIDGGAIDTREGGRAISYVDEDPEIRRTYEAALAAEGMKSGMPSWCYTQRVPPPGELEPGGV